MFISLHTKFGIMKGYYKLVAIAFWAITILYAESSLASSQIQDVSNGLVFDVSPKILNLTWNSTGNFSVHIENKNNMELNCNLTGGYLYNITSPDGTMLFGSGYKQNETMWAFLYPLQENPYSKLNTYDTTWIVPALASCGPKEACVGNICHYEQYCKLGNSSTYHIKLYCNIVYVNGLVSDDVTIKFSPETKTCIENWDCTNWSDCTQNSTRNRNCLDLDSCGTFYNKPTEIQSCRFYERAVPQQIQLNTTKTDYASEQPLTKTGFFTYLFNTLKQLLHRLGI